MDEQTNIKECKYAWFWCRSFKFVNHRNNYFEFRKVLFYCIRLRYLKQVFKMYNCIIIFINWNYCRYYNSLVIYHAACEYSMLCVLVLLCQTIEIVYVKSEKRRDSNVSLIEYFPVWTIKKV